MLDTFYALKFVHILTQPWESTKAFKAGIIDGNGNQIKDPTNDQRDTIYTKFHILVFNIKKLIEKVPFGKSTLAKYAAAMLLLKEETGKDLSEELLEYVINNNLVVDTVSESNQIDKYIQAYGLLYEDTLTAGIDMVDKKLPVKEDMVFDPDEYFCGHPVFHCDNESYFRSIKGKKPYARYKTYVGDDDTGKRIREFSVKNPKKSVILKDKSTGSMIFFRRAPR